MRSPFSQGRGLRSPFGTAPSVAGAVTMTAMMATFSGDLIASAATYLPAGAYVYALVSSPAEVSGAAVGSSTGLLTATMPSSGTLSAPFIVSAVGASTTYELSLTVTLTAGWSYSTVIAVGDSITAGTTGVTSWLEDVATEWGASSDNNASGGTVLQNTDSLSSNLYDGVVGRSITPTGDVIICAHGYNDARYNINDDTFNAVTYAEQYRSILRRWLVRFGRDAIWLVTPHAISDAGLNKATNPLFLATTRAGPQPETARAWFETYVAACRAVAKEFGVKLIDTYEIGYPAVTVDDIHPADVDQPVIKEAFKAPKISSLSASSSAPVGGTEIITVASGVTAYVIAADAETETALSIGENVATAGDHLVAWSDGGRWELSTITVVAAVSTDPTDGMTLTSAWSTGLAFSTLKPTAKYTIKVFVNRSAGDYGVLFEAGGTGSGSYAIVYDDGGTDRLLVILGNSSGSYTSAADLAVMTMEAPTGEFEIVVSGDCITAQKAALYIDDVLIATDTVSTTYLAGGRNGGLGQVWDQMAANPPGWAADGDGANAMAISAEVYADQATAEVLA